MTYHSTREQGGDYRVRPLADSFVTVYESPDAGQLYGFSPGIVVLPSGRLLATIDLGGKGVREQDGPKGSRHGYVTQGKVFISDDDGAMWRFTADFPFMHARPFLAGGSLYVLGHCVDIQIIRSDDGGETWTEPVVLTAEGDWHQAPCNVHYARGNIYLVMENIRDGDQSHFWPVSCMEPVLMRAGEQSDLLDPASWSYATRLTARDAIPSEKLDYFGVPFFTEMRDHRRGQINCAPVGWLETNVVQFVDPDHLWYDPAGRTFHLWMRAHTGGTGYAGIAKVVEEEDGRMVTTLETAPSGKQIAFVPCPGGQMKFHIVYDGVTKLYWLLSSQSTDSMTRPDRLPKERFDLPNNERHRLQLHFSKNCIDWCFAGLVCAGPSPKQSRHYASMAISGNDLLVLSRSGDERAASAHNGNLITFHRIRGFRDLAY
ncbi:sialidase family protein [Paenibacillus ginsengarvi]|uniref:Exo-alpha-sialidase n=1 Tax=Paenibacillus ginsengarvi TaxID=400777 RepID=A0A3B0CHR7_9BACL|nr:sialidase family protein [Paenibacillus ginsengarvi]RKN85255.1 exo-alpha-sialidase [Paenibacillus ginsengarvi]